MKAFTDIEQSKKLAEILPLESADMFLALNGTLPVMSKYIDDGFVTADDTAIPCWSLAALLDYLSVNFYVDIKYLDDCWELDCRVRVTYDKELINACYEMVMKLYQQKIL